MHGEVKNKMAEEENKMTRDEAIAYLERKDKIIGMPKTRAQVKKENEEQIAKVMKEGKIYGDPMVEVEFQ